MKSKKCYLLQLSSIILMSQLSFIYAQERSLFQEISAALKSNPDITKEQLEDKANKRIKFWQTVIRSFNNYGIKEDSDEMKKANKYLRRAQTNRSNLAGITSAKLSDIKRKLKRTRRLGAPRGRSRVSTAYKKRGGPRSTLGIKKKLIRKSPIKRKTIRAKKVQRPAKLAGTRKAHTAKDAKKITRTRKIRRSPVKKLITSSTTE